MKKYFVITIPGLGDSEPGKLQLINWSVRNWPQHDLEPILFCPNWRDGQPFQPKLQKLLKLIDTLTKEGQVSLIGTSAGASMAFNAFAARKNAVHKAVNVCGRLRAGQHIFRSLERMAKTSRAFKESVLAFEKAESTLKKNERRRLMTIRPLFGDELVPWDTANLAGAQNSWIVMGEHGVSISLSLLFAQQIFSFFQS